jgi:hypothetical protein
MPKKIEAWEASDGTIHKSLEEAELVDRERQRQAHIYEFAQTMWEAGTHTDDFTRFMTSNWEHLVQMVREFEGFTTITQNMLLGALKCDLWMSQNGETISILEMDAHHLQNAYRIANDQSRPGYHIFEARLLAELTDRGLRKEVDLEQN